MHQPYYLLTTNYHMKHKNTFYILISITSLFLSSCYSKIPGGPIKSYINGFSITKAEENIHSASLVYENIEIDSKGEEIGKAYCYFEFNNSDKDYPYLYLYRTYEGTLIQEDGIKEKEVLYYISPTNEEIGLEKNNGVIKNVDVSKTSINDSITLFFYREKSYDYYRGGLYYGDLIKISAEKWHMNFSINNEGLLRYKLTNDMTYEGAIFNTDFTITKEGMLKDYYYDGQMTETKEKLVNTINVDYNVEIDKKETI